MRSFDAPVTPIPEPAVAGPAAGRGYRLHLKSQDGATLRWEAVDALTDETAIHHAKRRLEQAATVEVWSHAGWLCSVERGRPAARAAGRRG